MPHCPAKDNANQDQHDKDVQNAASARSVMWRAALDNTIIQSIVVLEPDCMWKVYMVESKHCTRFSSLTIKGKRNIGFMKDMRIVLRLRDARDEPKVDKKNSSLWFGNTTTARHLVSPIAPHDQFACKTNVHLLESPLFRLPSAIHV